MLISDNLSHLVYMQLHLVHEPKEERTRAILGLHTAVKFRKTARDNVEN
jgi:hypothetical protein